MAQKRTTPHKKARGQDVLRVAKGERPQITVDDGVNLSIAFGRVNAKVVGLIDAVGQLESVYRELRSEVHALLNKMQAATPPRPDHMAETEKAVAAYRKRNKKPAKKKGGRTQKSSLH